MSMSDDVKWNDDPPTGNWNMGVEGVGHLKLINGVWVAENGDRYFVELTPSSLTPADGKTTDA